MLKLIGFCSLLFFLNPLGAQEASYRELCSDLQLEVTFGGPLVVIGREKCRFDLYRRDCREESTEWERLRGSLTIDETGVIIFTDILGHPDYCYRLTPWGETEEVGKIIRENGEINRYTFGVFIVLVFLIGFLTYRKQPS